MNNEYIMISAMLQAITVSSPQNYKIEVIIKTNIVIRTLEIPQNSQNINEYFSWVEVRKEDQIQNYSNIRLIVTLKSQEDRSTVGIAIFNLNEITNSRHNEMVTQLDEDLFVKVAINLIDLTSLDFSHFPIELRKQYTLNQKSDLFAKFKQEVAEWKFKYDSLSESINLLTNELTTLSTNLDTDELSSEIQILRNAIKSKLLNFLNLYQQQNQDFNQLRNELDIYRGETCIKCSQSLLKDNLEGFQNQIYDLEVLLREQNIINSRKDETIATSEKQIEQLKQQIEEHNKQYQLQQQSFFLVRQNYAKSKQQTSELQQEVQKLSSIIEELNQQNMHYEQKLILENNNYLELEKSSLKLINIFLNTLELYKQWNFEIAHLFNEDQKEKAESIKSIYQQKNIQLIQNNQNNLSNLEKQIHQLKLSISQQQLSFLQISIESSNLMKQTEMNLDDSDAPDYKDILLKDKINLSREYQQFIMTMKEQNQKLLENYKLHEEYCKLSVEQNEKEVANLKHKLADIVNIAMEYGSTKLVEEMLIRVSQ